MGPLYDVCVIQGTRSNPSMTEAIIMGMNVEPRIMDTSQSNRGTQGHHLGPYFHTHPEANNPLSAKTPHRITGGPFSFQFIVIGSLPIVYSNP